MHMKKMISEDEDENEEEELVKKQEKLRKQKEMLTLTSKLDAANAKVAILSETRSKVSVAHGLNEYLEKTLKLQESKESTGKEPVELKLGNVHDPAKGTQDVSVKPKTHALPPLPVHLHPRKEQPHFLPTLKSPSWSEQSRHMSSSQSKQIFPHPQPISSQIYDSSQQPALSRNMQPSHLSTQPQGPSRLHPQGDSPVIHPNGTPVGTSQDDVRLYDILQRQNYKIKIHQCRNC
ncbi:hypothetical protein QQF64_031501 [Cirrhinus molitorella]|uniref:Uncharacterized protein n=1 Tax=Cirrhinus molitorella TaxID=172907 RepID=A0ABR3MX63_9TELE